MIPNVCASPASWATAIAMVSACCIGRFLSAVALRWSFASAYSVIHAVRIGTGHSILIKLAVRIPVYAPAPMALRAAGEAPVLESSPIILRRMQLLGL